MADGPVRVTFIRGDDDALDAEDFEYVGRYRADSKNPEDHGTTQEVKEFGAEVEALGQGFNKTEACDGCDCVDEDEHPEIPEGCIRVVTVGPDGSIYDIPGTRWAFSDEFVFIHDGDNPRAGGAFPLAQVEAVIRG